MCSFRFTFLSFGNFWPFVPIKRYIRQILKEHIYIVEIKNIFHFPAQFKMVWLNRIVRNKFWPEENHLRVRMEEQEFMPNWWQLQIAGLASPHSQVWALQVNHKKNILLKKLIFLKFAWICFFRRKKANGKWKFHSVSSRYWCRPQSHLWRCSVCTYNHWFSKSCNYCLFYQLFVYKFSDWSCHQKRLLHHLHRKEEN